MELKKTVEKEFLKIRFYVQFTEIKNRRTTFPEKELHFDKRLLISERIYTYCYQNIFQNGALNFSTVVKVDGTVDFNLKDINGSSDAFIKKSKWDKYGEK